MFKIGDYVKCINDFDCHGLEVGKIYKIEDSHLYFNYTFRK